jgi:hypothetical protein
MKPKYNKPYTNEIRDKARLLIQKKYKIKERISKEEYIKKKYYRQTIKKTLL